MGDERFGGDIRHGPLLRQERDAPRESFGGKGSNVGFRGTAAQGDAAGIRFNKAAERAEQRRFAAAVWAEDAGDFAAAEFARDAAENFGVI